MAKPLQPSVYFETLGCPKNEADTRAMAELLEAEGISIVRDMSASDVIVVNTCAFIQSAVEENIEAILDILDDPVVQKRAIPVVISGCLPARYQTDLEAEFPEIAAFVPCHAEGDIAHVIKRCLSSTSRITDDASVNMPDTAEARAIHTEVTENAPSAPSYAYVKISDGCSRCCSYCTIPSIRGPYRSFPSEAILDEVHSLVSDGIAEIILIAQDTGIWGKDLSGMPSLASLLAMLAETFPNTLIRVMYLQPSGLTDELLDTMSRYPNIAHYFDIPLQHVNPDILHSMGRTGSAEQYRALARRIREKLPDAALRTTLIAGYPGESEEQFQELVDFVSEGAFDYVGVFPYSREEGTRAAELPNQIDEEEKAYRASVVRDEADAVSASLMSARIGQTYPVLIEGVEEDGQLFGRLSIQAPEIDGVFFIDRGEVGELARARIEDALLYDMEGSYQ